jgi:hypothetical protein
LFGIKRKQTKIPAVQWEIGQVKTGRKGTGEITNNNNKKKATYKTAAELAVKKRRIRLQQSWQSKSSHRDLSDEGSKTFLGLLELGF